MPARWARMFELYPEAERIKVKLYSADDGLLCDFHLRRHPPATAPSEAVSASLHLRTGRMASCRSSRCCAGGRIDSIFVHEASALKTTAALDVVTEIDRPERRPRAILSITA